MMALKDSEKTKNYTDDQKLINPMKWNLVDERLKSKISNLVQRVAMHSRSESEEHFEHLIQHTIDLTTDSKNSDKELFRIGSNKRPFQYEFIQSYKEIIRDKFIEPHRAETKVAWKYLPTQYYSTTFSYVHHLRTAALTAPNLETPSEYYKTILLPTTTKGTGSIIMITDKWHDTRDNVFVMFARHILCHSATITRWKALNDALQSYEYFLIRVLHENADIAEMLGKPITDVFMDSAQMVGRWSESAARGNLTHYCNLLMKRHMTNWDLNPILDLYSLFLDKDTQPWVKHVTSAYLEYPLVLYTQYKDLNEIMGGLFNEAFVKPLRRQFNLSKKDHAPNGFYYLRMKRISFLLNRYAYYNGYPNYALLHKMDLEKNNPNGFLKYGFRALPEPWPTRTLYLGPSKLLKTSTGLMKYRTITPIRPPKKNNTVKTTHQPQVYLDKEDQKHLKLKLKVQTEIMPETAMNFSADIHSFNTKSIKTNSEIYQTNQSTTFYKRKTLKKFHFTQTLQKYTDKLPTNNKDVKRDKLTENTNELTYKYKKNNEYFDATQKMKIYKSDKRQKDSNNPIENGRHYQKRVTTREYRDRQNISGSVQKYRTVHKRKKRKRSSTQGRTTDIFKKVRSRIDNSNVKLTQYKKKQVNNRPNIGNENSWRRKFKSFLKKSKIVQKIIEYSKRKRNNRTRVREAR